MTTITIKKMNNSEYHLKLRSHDAAIFEACIEELKTFVPAIHRAYDPRMKIWVVDARGYPAMQRWLTYCQAAVNVKVEWLFAAASGPSKEEWAPPPPPRRQPTKDDAFKALFLLPTAPASVIRASYKALALECHPDRPGGDTAAMQRINEAYELLTRQMAA